MNWHVIEELIRKAQEEGQFDNLEGAGKPLPKDEFGHLPPDIRMAMRILKNSGFDDEALFVQREMGDLESRMKAATPEEKSELEKIYSSRITKMNRLLSKKGIKTNSTTFQVYNEKINDRLKWD